MILATTTNDALAIQSENILTSFANFDDLFTYNEVSGGINGVAENNTLMPYFGERDLLVTFTGTDEYRFNSGGTQFQYTIPYTGSYKFSFRLKSTNPDATITFGINVTKKVGGGSFTPVDTIECTAHTSTIGYVDGEWNTFFADIEFDANDIVDFDFSTQTDDFSGTKLGFGGFKCEYVDRGQTLPSFYTPVPIKTTVWQSRVDTTNTQNISADTETNFGFTGTSESNNASTLLSTTGLITPTKVGNVTTIDYYFDFDAPSGADRFVDVFLKVNSVIYRASSTTLSRTAGETEYISGSFTLPVGTDFKTYGAQISIKSTEAITIENRYISVVEQTNL